MEAKIKERIHNAVEVKLTGTEIKTPTALEELTISISNNHVINFLSLDQIPVDILSLLKCIAKHKTLARVFITNTKLDMPSITAVKHVLLTTNKLVYLCLWCSVIAAGLKENKTLRGLNLARNNITSAGVKHIADALCINSKLLKIHLMYNPIDETGWEILGNILISNVTLKWLNLAGTKGGELGCKALGDALQKNKTLRVLNLFEANIGENGCKLIAEGLAKNAVLKNLWLGKNKIGPTGCKYIADALKENTELEKLEIYDNEIGPTGYNSLEEILKSKGKLKFVDLSKDCRCNGIGKANVSLLKELANSSVPRKKAELLYND